MKIQPLKINNIPALIWGEPSHQVYIHVHGKMSRKEYAKDFAMIAEAKGYQTLSFDLPEHGERDNPDYRCDIWNGMYDLSLIADYAFTHWQNVSLFACSLGAYFSLNTYSGKNFNKCLFQSPVLDMTSLIQQMFIWFDVTEEKLRMAKEIATPIDPLRWDYYQYVKKHPIQNWDIPTAILYGGKDNLQSLEVIQAFAHAHHCQLTIAPDSEHPFMANEDLPIVQQWLKASI